MNRKLFLFAVALIALLVIAANVIAQPSNNVKPLVQFRLEKDPTLPLVKQPLLLGKLGYNGLGEVIVCAVFWHTGPMQITGAWWAHSNALTTKSPKIYPLQGEIKADVSKGAEQCVKISKYPEYPGNPSILESLKVFARAHNNGEKGTYSFVESYIIDGKTYEPWNVLEITNIPKPRDVTIDASKLQPKAKPVRVEIKSILEGLSELGKLFSAKLK